MSRRAPFTRRAPRRQEAVGRFVAAEPARRTGDS